MSEEQLDDLERFTAMLEALRFGFPQRNSDFISLRDTAVSRLRENALARVQDLDAPLVAVLVGSTGVGKSTLMNSLAGRVTPVSVRRPTTLTPVLVHHPDDELWVAGNRILGSFEKLRQLPNEEVQAESLDSKDDATAAKPEIMVRVSERIHPGLVLVDCPDLDSYFDLNREVARHLLEVADLWIFVTNSQRYQEPAGIRLLEKAASRDVAMGIVLNRVSQGTLLDTKGDLQEEMRQAGLESNIPIFAILEGYLEDGDLPEEDLAPVRQWLESFATDSLLRTSVARQNLFGSMREIFEMAQQVMDAFEGEFSYRDAIITRISASRREAEDTARDTWFSSIATRGKFREYFQDYLLNFWSLLDRGDPVKNKRLRWRQRLLGLLDGAEPATVLRHNLRKMYLEVLSRHEANLFAARRDLAAYEEDISQWLQDPANSEEAREDAIAKSIEAVLVNLTDFARELVEKRDDSGDAQQLPTEVLALFDVALSQPNHSRDAVDVLKQDFSNVEITEKATALRQAFLSQLQQLLDAQNESFTSRLRDTKERSEQLNELRKLFTALRERWS